MNAKRVYDGERGRRISSDQLKAIAAAGPPKQKPKSLNCVVGKHRACASRARDEETDETVFCGCSCHINWGGTRGYDRPSSL